MDNPCIPSLELVRFRVRILMPLFKRIIKLGTNAILGPLGYEIRQKTGQNNDPTAGYQRFVDEANKLGMDVNDYLEQKLGMTGTLEYLQRTVFPYLREDSVVCNLGPATGQGARHIAPRLTKGELHLVDYSPWVVNFLKSYYRSNPRVHIHGNDGLHLPFQKERFLDIVFSFGVFVALRLCVIYGYAQEFSRVLKPGGYVVIEYSVLRHNNHLFNLLYFIGNSCCPATVGGSFFPLCTP